MPDPHLSEVDWHDAAQTARALEDALRRFARPDRLAALLRSARTDPRLLGLSEVRPWGNRMVLHEDPSSGARLRLQHWAGGDLDPHGRPHNHRWAFASTIPARQLRPPALRRRGRRGTTAGRGRRPGAAPAGAHRVRGQLLRPVPAGRTLRDRGGRNRVAAAEGAVRGGVRGASEPRSHGVRGTQVGRRLRSAEGASERPFGTADADSLGALLSSLGLLD